MTDVIIEDAKYLNAEKTAVQATVNGKEFTVPTFSPDDGIAEAVIKKIEAGNVTIADYVKPPATQIAHDNFVNGMSGAFTQALLEATGQTQAVKALMLANAQLPEWDSTKTDYKHGDKVRHTNYVWICTTDDTTSEPDWIPGDWELA